MTRNDITAYLLRAVDIGAVALSQHSLVSLVSATLSKAIDKDFPVMLTIWAAQAAGQPSSVTLAAASAWLALYVAAKLADDVQDGDVGFLPEVSPSIVVNVSLALIFVAHKCIAAHNEQEEEVMACRRLLLLHELSCNSLRIAEGQQASLLEPDSDIDPLDYAWRVTSLKGALPFALACRLGAISVGARRELVECLSRYGQAIGEAVQIWDDATGMIEKRQSDVNPLSLAVAYGFSVAKGSDRRQLARLFAEAREGRLEAATAMWCLLEDMGALRYLSIEATTRAMRAKSELNRERGNMVEPAVARLNALADALDVTNLRRREKN